jgi:hypothetical protein
MVIGFSFAFNYNIKAGENRRLFEKEMAFRLDMEEKVTNLRNENIELAAVLKSKDLEIKQKDQLIVDYGQSDSNQQETIENLRLELKGMTLLKEQLEKNLREELSLREQ